ncbi:MAG: hypothetical protein C0401_05540 [Anaerolinea sp.]|nr:hypothetical protein [Anaerolinea sp.]
MVKRVLVVLFSMLFVITIVAGYFIFLSPSRINLNAAYVIPWIRNPSAHPDWAVTALEICRDSPFVMPTSGLIGYIWGDSFRPGHRHQGIDIFGRQVAGVTPVYAVADGYLSRLADWKSTVIIRIPSDPFLPSRQIWTYYTHMADSSGTTYIVSDFPPGTVETFVKAGTLLGYQGNYSGAAGNPVGVHLHFSIVRDNGNGKFLNELDFFDTLDPSPYFGLSLNKKFGVVFPIKCSGK